MIPMLLRCSVIGLWLTVLLPLSTGTAAEPPSDARQLQLTVAETAGIRRFGYPVSTTLSLAQPVKDVTHFRLLENGKAVPAQFRALGDPAEGIRAVTLDFYGNHAPHESHEYVVEYGAGVPLQSESRNGVHVATVADELRVSHSNGLQFVVPRNLLGLLRQVRTDRTEYLRQDSPGLFIRYKDDIHYRVGGFGPYCAPTVARVVREGPLAAALRFESTEALRGNRSVKSVVEMTFPSTKSWVQVVWEVDDPQGYVAGLGADLNLNLEGEPALVDFGAGSYVYAVLRKEERTRLHAGSLTTPVRRETPAWEVLLGPAGGLRPYVTAPLAPTAPKAEGWAHVMDQQRCTALALADFADADQESEITVDANGRLQLWKQFAKSGAVPPGTKKITFWLHFVTMPVQVGAATSPQAMLAPLAVRVRPSP
jgi:hypothetical protein